MCPNLYVSTKKMERTITSIFNIKIHKCCLLLIQAKFTVYFFWTTRQHKIPTYQQSCRELKRHSQIERQMKYVRLHRLLHQYFHAFYISPKCLSINRVRSDVALSLSIKDFYSKWEDKYFCVVTKIPGGGHVGHRGCPSRRRPDRSFNIGPCWESYWYFYRTFKKCALSEIST